MATLPNRPMSGRTALVTGSSGGIGRATALGLARLGADLPITGRDRRRIEAAAREIRTEGGKYTLSWPTSTPRMKCDASPRRSCGPCRWSMSS